MYRLALAFIVLLLLPAPAHAAEGFLGVLEDGRTVRFSSQEPFALSTPRRPVGLAPGERLVAVSDGPHGPVGIGSSARLYALDPDTGRATAIGAPFEQGLRGSRFSLAAAPGAASARLLSDVGQDLVVDLQTGATQLGPVLLNAADGARVRPAADVAADGRLVGVQLGPSTFLRETAAGSSAMEASPLALPPEPKLAEPLGFQIGADGGATCSASRAATCATVSPSWCWSIRSPEPLSGVRDPGRSSSPAVSTPSPPSARRRGPHGAAGHCSPPPHDLGPHPARSRACTDGHMDEAAQVTATLWLGRRPTAFGFLTRDTPGVVDMRENISDNTTLVILRPREPRCVAPSAAACASPSGSTTSRATPGGSRARRA